MQYKSHVFPDLSTNPLCLNIRISWDDHLGKIRFPLPGLSRGFVGLGTHGTPSQCGQKNWNPHQLWDSISALKALQFVSSLGPTWGCLEQQRDFIKTSWALNPLPKVISFTPDSSMQWMKPRCYLPVKRRESCTFCLLISPAIHFSFSPVAST